MSGDIQAKRDEGWREAGRKLAPLLRSSTSAVVTGMDERAAGFVALGIADSEAPYHSIIIANLWGSSELDRLLDVEEDVPGVSDCFTYGISLPGAARVSAGNQRLEIIGGGTEPYDRFSVYRSRRWKAYAERLLENGCLLLLLAPVDAVPVHELIAQVDGTVLVGVSEVGSAPNSRTIAKVMDPLVRGNKPEPRPGFSWKRMATILFSLILIAAGVAAGLKYFWTRQPGYSGQGRAPSADTGVSVPSTAGTAASSTPLAALASPPVLNPADSSGSARYSVEILAANTQSGAIFTLQKYRAFIPAGTVSAIPVGPDQALWYKVIGGAFATREEAESLLVSLRRRKILSDSAGSVVETPLAFLVDSIAANAGMAARVQEAVNSFPDRNFLLYGLVQKDGSARIYAGAFSFPGETSAFAGKLKTAGLTPALVYRTGRNP